ncbi:MAG: hypothetical protein NTU51_04335 [Bacteroidetes bacterium]|nr:hypothetical protein [Bacteroidota bacterium]
MKTIRNILTGVIILLFMYSGYSQEPAPKMRVITLQGQGEDTSSRLLGESAEILSARLTCMSLRDFSVTKNEVKSALIVTVKDTISTGLLQDILTAPGKLNFYENAGRDDSLIPIFKQRSTREIILEAHADFSNKEHPELCITFRENLWDIFKEATARNIDKPITLMIDGNVNASPRVNAEIAGGKITLTGKGFSKSEVRKLVALCSNGELPLKFIMICVK